MRKVALGMVLVASSFALFNCAAPAASSDPTNGDAPSTQDAGTPKAKRSGSTESMPPAAAATDSGPKPFDAGAAVVDAARPVADAAVPPPPSNGACRTLNPCCAKLDAIVDRLACVGAVFAGNDTACLAAEALYCNNPGGIFGQGNGPNCKKLKDCCSSNQYISSDLSCTRDVPAGDETVCSDDLYFYQTDPYQDCL